MSNRERWIVYPLLFYALVMGFKATYRDPLEFRCRTIECHQLNVRMINGTSVLAAMAAATPTMRADMAVDTAQKTDRPGETQSGSDSDDQAGIAAVPAPGTANSDAPGPLVVDYHPPADDDEPADRVGETPDSGATPPSDGSQ